jgi:hypothetical protein
MSRPLVSDALWTAIEPLLPPEPPKPKGGRPRCEDRAALSGIIFVLRSGIPWERLPREDQEEHRDGRDEREDRRDDQRDGKAEPVGREDVKPLHDADTGRDEEEREMGEQALAGGLERPVRKLGRQKFRRVIAGGQEREQQGHPDHGTGNRPARPAGDDLADELAEKDERQGNDHGTPRSASVRHGGAMSKPRLVLPPG